MQERDIAWSVKERVSCRDFAASMGLNVNAKGFALCPFHGDSDASLKIYEDGRGWCCYGCHRGGDVINLASAWYGTGFRETLRRIDQDFGLNLYGEGAGPLRSSDTIPARRIFAQTRRRRLEAQAREAEDQYLDCYADWLHWKTISEMLSPQANGGTMYKGCAIALRRAQEREPTLNELESRRNALCRELKKAATY